MRTRTSFVARLATLMLIGALAFAAACGSGGDDDPDATATPNATAQPFDRQLMTGVVLNPSDLPEGFESNGAFSPEGVGFTSVFLGDGLRYQSTAIRYDTEAAANTELQRNRRVIPALSAGAREENYAIPGTDQAFLYRVESPPGLASWAVRGHILLFIQISPTDYESPSPRAIDDAEFARVAAIVGQRANTLEQTPELITPIPSNNQALPTPSAEVTPEVTPMATP